MNSGNAICVLVPNIYQQVRRDADFDKPMSTHVFRASTQLVESTDILLYLLDDSYDNTIISEKYDREFPDEVPAINEMKDAVTTIRTHRVIVPYASQLAVYLKYVLSEYEVETPDDAYIRLIHRFADSVNHIDERNDCSKSKHLNIPRS